MGASALIPRSLLPTLQIRGDGSQFRHFAHQFIYQELNMNKDQAKGRIEEAKGKVKEVTGKLVGNEDLEIKGQIQKSGGIVQSAYGDLKEDIKDASEDK
jgi:uncharacterized protein YjbJ (UPF0337 family)